MHAVADICVIPLTGSVSVRAEVARAHQLLAESGLKVHLHAYGTNVEGPLPEVLAALQTVHETLHAEGCPRLSTTVKLGTRTDKASSMDGKVQAVRDILDGD